MMDNKLIKSIGLPAGCAPNPTALELRETIDCYDKYLIEIETRIAELEADALKLSVELLAVQELQGAEVSETVRVIAGKYIGDDLNKLAKKLEPAPFEPNWNIPLREYIKELMDERGWSVEVLANLIDVRSRDLESVLDGHEPMPQDYIPLFAKQFHVNEQTLQNWYEKDKQNEN